MEGRDEALPSKGTGQRRTAVAGQACILSPVGPQHTQAQHLADHQHTWGGKKTEKEGEQAACLQCLTSPVDYNNA